MVDNGAGNAALFHACPAFYATFLVNDVALLGGSRDAISRAVFSAKGTSYTLFCDVILQQALTYPSRTGFINDMGNVFVSEILDRREDRIWSSLS